MANEIVDEALLESLGFKTVSETLKKAKEFKRKMAVAYEHFRFVRQEKIDQFNQKLKEKTIKRSDSVFGGSTFQVLAFSSVASYEKSPPMDVLLKMKDAADKKCFDSFEIAYIKEVTDDPILFGRIEGCPDRFYVAQWDNDVTIEQIIDSNEG